MIDIELLRKDPSAVIKNLQRRGVAAERIEQLAALDLAWRELTEKIERLRAQKNETNTRIIEASAKQRKKLIEAMRGITTEEKTLAAEYETVSSQRLAAWKKIPNLVHEDVPDGGEGDSHMVREVGTVPAEETTPLDYLALSEPHLIDLARAAKVSGSRFVYLKGQLARLELALISFAVDKLMESGFTPVIPPVLVGKRAMSGMGYLDQAGEEIYQTRDDLYLVGTSEQSIGPMFMDETLADPLPLRFVGVSSCFRREAGSHGKDVRGILRLHQFDKVEMFSVADPNTSEGEHEFLLQQQEALMHALELPYRVVMVAAHDLGFPAAKTYDIETWIPSQHTYRETHSTSNTTDYQARRLNIRLKKDGEAKRPHMLNGTAIAIPRILIALLENHQQADGSVAIPKALHPYLPFTTIETSPA